MIAPPRKYARKESPPSPAINNECSLIIFLAKDISLSVCLFVMKSDLGAGEPKVELFKIWRQSGHTFSLSLLRQDVVTAKPP